MLPIYKIPVPTPYAVGPVNCYLIKVKPYTLIDPGPETEEAKHALTEGLKTAGLGIQDIERVLLTHSHSDHSGLADYICRSSGAKVWVHPYELAKLKGDYTFIKAKVPFLLEAGIPESLIKQIAKDRDVVPPPFLSMSDAVLVKGGEYLDFDGGLQMRFLHLPGHAVGHLCLYVQETGDFFSGDFLLAHITPNPVVDIDPLNPGCRARTLKQYLDGLDTVDKLNLTTVWTGHGENIYNHREIIKKNRKQHYHRLNKIYNIIKESEKTAYETSKVLYPQLQGFNILLGVSEALAHLDYLSDEGRLVQFERHGVSYFKVT